VGYLIALGLVIVITVIGKLLQYIPTFDPIDTGMIYLLGVAISAAYLGFGQSLMVSFLSVLSLDFFFIPPVLTLEVPYEQHQIAVLILFVSAIAISCLSPRIRR
jgi:two-component system sensor histidine kinase KdpD